mgnify:CR=1 FL=1
MFGMGRALMLKDRTRVLTIITIAFELAFLSSFLTVAYGSLNTLVATLQGERPIEIDMDRDPITGDGKISLGINVQNRGFYGIHVGLHARLLTNLGQQIAEGIDSKYVEPGDEGRLSIVLAVNRENFDGLNLSNARFAIQFDFRTFFDLVSFGMELEARP